MGFRHVWGFFAEAQRGEDAEVIASGLRSDEGFAGGRARRRDNDRGETNRHGRVPLLRPLAQRPPTERAQALHGRVLRFIAGVERAGAVFRVIEHRGHVFTQLRMALQPATKSDTFSSDRAGRFIPLDRAEPRPICLAQSRFVLPSRLTLLSQRHSSLRFYPPPFFPTADFTSCYTRP